MSKKAAGAISGVCLLLGVLLMSMYNFLYKAAAMAKVPKVMLRLAYMRGDMDQSSLSTREGGAIVGVLMMLAAVVAFVAIENNWLEDKYAKTRVRNKDYYGWKKSGCQYWR